MASEKPVFHRSKVLTDPLGGGQAGLLRELGLVDNRSGILKAWGRGLGDRLIWRAREDNKFPMEVTNFLYDDAKLMQGAILGLRPKDGIGDINIKYIGTSEYRRCPPWSSLHSAASQISSMSLSSSSRLLLVTMLGKELPAAYVNLNYVEDENCDTWGSEIGILEMRTRSSDKSFWASSADPYSGETSFAIAASNGALVLSVGEGRWMEQSGERYSDSPEVMAVDWLSSNVVMKGCKDGGVRLWDIRSRGEFRESRESLVQHPSQINHARRIDENTIVVAGLESQLCTYDLRFQSALTISGQVTRAYNRFPSYQNLDLGHLARGFDVHGDLVAAATDDDRIRIWDVKRGFEVKQAKWRYPSRMGNSICVQFDDTDKGLRVMAAAGDIIAEIAWLGEK